MSDLEITDKPNQDAPVERAASDDRTIVISQPPVADKTIVVNNRNFDRANDDDAIFRTNRVNTPDPADIPQEYISSDNHFLLKGDYYKLVSTLSENSGEAQVYLVENHGLQYVLKVYYPNYDINKKLMQIIHNFQFEMIVKLYDFGKTYVDGKRRSYELMEYLQGGTLQDIHIGGDFNKFRRIALQTAASLAYCHQNNVLHKDIKPSNFFFRDAEHTQIVLGDFGISSLVEKDGKTYRTTQARTPVYAAPEMYVDVIDGEVEITPAADFYSLGITLFAVWLGENPMSSNERNMMRQKSEGRLPRLDELPPRVKRLVQGLTAVNAQNRWKYSEVERWFLGEDVPIDETSPFLRYKSFIVDPDRNLVADNIQELVPMLLDNESLAINYLYNGRIVSWLEACGNMKLSTVVKDIVTNRYPVDKKAGLMTSVYLMDPSYNYRDVQGDVCEDIHSIALSLLSFKERYALELQNPNDSLFLWLETHTKVNVNRLRSYFKPDAEPHVVVMRMVYEIDPDIPFLSNHASANIKEIVHSFGYASPTDDDWHSLIDGRLLSWMYCHEDVMACESLKIMIQDQPYSQSLAYKVLYNLDRTAAYDLCEANTPEAIGTMLCEQLKSMQHTPNQEMEAQMQDYLDPDGRFHYYAQLQGWYQIAADASHCFDMKSAENIERLSAYDLHTAFYRFCQILGSTPVYVLPNGTELQSLDDLKDEQNATYMRNEIRTGSLSQWMSVFYHEDPHKDFSEEYSYERELERWVLAMGEIDSQQKYYKRLIKARQDTAERVQEVRHEWKSAHLRELIWRYLYYGLLLVWLGLLIFVGISEHSKILAYPYLTILLPVGGMTAIIVAVRAFFNGIGPLLAFLMGAISVATAFVPMWLLQFVDSHKPSWVTAVLIFLTIIYATVCHFTKYRHDDKTSIKTVREILLNDDINSSLLEPLYYTFKTKSFRYKSTKFSLLDDISNQLRSISGENVLHYVLWGLLMLVLILEFYFFSPRFLNKEIKIVKDNIEQQVEQVQYDLIK
jgi:serine/threonine protein kinase